MNSIKKAPPAVNSIKKRLTLLALLVVLATVAASAATGGPVAGVLGMSEASAAKSKPCKKAEKAVKKKCKKGNTKACKKAKKQKKRKCKKPVPNGPTKTVGVFDDYYGPDKVSIKAGSSINWVWDNENLDSHDVVLDSGPKGVSIRHFSSPGTYAINAKFKRKFTTPGTYNFYCSIHSTIMRMKVIVKK